MNTSLIERLAGAGRLDRIFIGGEWVLPAGQARSAVIDPSTEEPVAEIALGSAQDVADGRGRGAARIRDLVREFPAEPGRASRPRPRPDPGARRSRSPRRSRRRWAAPSAVARGAQVPIAAEHIRVARDLAAQLSLPHASRRHGHHARGHRRVRPDHALELAALPDHREGRPGAGGGMHRRPEAQRAVAAERAAVRRSDARRRRSAGRVQPGQRRRAGGRRRAGRRTPTWT